MSTLHLLISYSVMDKKLRANEMNYTRITSMHCLNAHVPMGAKILA